jgi:RNA polymerase sigma factor (sigma-70 family)
MELDSALTLSLVEKNDEAALAELVRRYVTLVYSAALRQVGGDTHLAEDVTQVVFTRFVRQASSLRDRSSLGGWFYSTTRHVAANVVRSERRRKDREIKAQMENSGSSTEATADWSLLQPVLDDAMHEISESDRDAIRLRFLERLPMATVGERLGVTENAAAKRIERALEKLRTRFARHGITSTSIALATALEGKACVAAPAGLVAGVMESTLAAVTAAGAGTAGLGLFAFMTTTKATLCLVAAAVIFGAGAVSIRTKAQSAQSALAASIRSTDALSAKLTVLQSQLEEERKRVGVAEHQNGKLLLAAKTMQAASAAQAQAEGEPITSEMV